MDPDSLTSGSGPSAHRHRRTLLRWSAVAAVSGFGLGLVWPGDDEASGPVALPGFSTLDDHPIRLDTPGQRGLLVCFWATSCTLCLQDFPALSQLRNEWAPRGITLVAVAMTYDREEMVRHVARMNPDAPPIAMDSSGGIAAALGPIRETPTHCLLDPQGRLVSRDRGRLHPATLTPRLRALVKRT